MKVVFCRCGSTASKLQTKMQNHGLFSSNKIFISVSVEKLMRKKK